MGLILQTSGCIRSCLKLSLLRALFVCRFQDCPGFQETSTRPALAVLKEGMTHQVCAVHQSTVRVFGVGSDQTLEFEYFQMIQKLFLSGTYNPPKNIHIHWPDKSYAS